ncbi:AAA family ATPase [Sinorhizobium medicae]|uniref:ParA family protein n=1 Tax=Sinorhizobium medicae TaxID=110321 RepID=UPI000462912D|nr:ParA family protein [Sinorhizobium medicae]MDX0429923.1 AAA family ATPase [Sinorhizobium medicae]MDX0460601.1 AAA family ATPase [Sinorhizobium medicae]MDX0533037.1 AAA family ATPase [Sinorhizobium medicae]MDX0572647.1 AAA family ATPase [Sinorhizobium medicae]MDX0671462.1 AAA family ATPase [Sinorhizobium medicae]
MAKRLVVFNHKGGVSKTTTAYNVGWSLAEHSKVLFVDADAQCNLSGLLLNDDFEAYYLDDATKDQNLKDGVSPAFDGKPVPLQAVDCFSPARNRNVFLLAGHANLSAYDAALTFAQTSNNAITTLQNLPGAFSELIRLTEERYEIDYTIIDLNPSLSAINQNLFLISDGFLIPTNPDPFSIMALQTLKVTLPRWVSWKRSAINLFEDSAYPLRPGTPKFIGTVIQRFNIRKGRAAAPYRNNIDEINEVVGGEVFSALQAAGMALPLQNYAGLEREHFCLAEIPDFQGLLPKAYEAGVPVFALEDEELDATGPVLQGFKERRAFFSDQFQGIAAKVGDLLDHA